MSGQRIDRFFYHAKNEINFLYVKFCVFSTHTNFNESKVGFRL
jgi:hypothetical protein